MEPRYFKKAPGAQNITIAKWLDKQGYEAIPDPHQILYIDGKCSSVCEIPHMSFHCTALTCRDDNGNRFIWRRKDDICTEAGE